MNSYYTQFSSIILQHEFLSKMESIDILNFDGKSKGKQNNLKIHNLDDLFRHIEALVTTINSFLRNNDKNENNDNNSEKKTSVLTVLNMKYSKEICYIIHSFLSFCSTSISSTSDDSLSSIEFSLTSLTEELSNENSLILSSIQYQRYMGWCDTFRDQYEKSIINMLKETVIECCDDDFSESKLSDLKDFLNQGIFPLLHLLFDNILTDSELVSLSEKLRLVLFMSFSAQRSSQLFEIVMDYPDSSVAIHELSEAAQVAKSLSQIGKTFRAIIEKRLLHAGASTSQILEMYLSMISAVREIDSSDLLLNYIGDPVRKFLVQRKDTVRCIVESLREGKSSNLHSDLRRGGSLEYLADSDDEGVGPGEDWEPRKRNTELMVSGSTGLDALALLVSIYGSTEVFVDEYRSILAENLLQTSLSDFNSDQEIATLELLKIRFGEESLQSCEVMLRDLEESVRLNKQIIFLKHNCIIISDHYWPQMQNQHIKLHPCVIAIIDEYKKSYNNIKKPRLIEPYDWLGTVELELDFEDGSVLDVTAKPLQATLLFHLVDSNESGGNGLTADELGNLMEVDEDEIRQGMGLWISRGIVDFRYDRYTISEERPHAYDSNVAMNLGMIDTSQTKAMIDKSDRDSAAHETFNGYVKSMLTSHGTMTLERIHSMLRMISMAGEHKFDMNHSELQNFLSKLIEEDEIELLNGHYSLRKANI